MLYYEIKCSTPYINEESYYYVKIEKHNLQNIDDIANNYMYRFVEFLYDEQARKDYNDKFDDYFNDCHYIVAQISREEYYDKCFWDKED